MLRALSPVALVLTVAACASAPASQPPIPTGTTTTTSAEIDAARVDHEALVALDDALCAHEDACGRIGPGRLHDSRAACLDVMRKVASRELTPLACRARPVAKKNVEACATAIHDERCDVTIDDLDGLRDCVSDMLCSR